MAVQFEFYKNPGTGEEGEEEQYHPRVVNFNSVSTEYLAAPNIRHCFRPDGLWKVCYHRH